MHAEVCEKTSYNDLAPCGRMRKKRCLEARAVLGGIAGGEDAVGALVKDLAGYQNMTTDALVRSFEECLDARSEEGRLQRIMHLYPFRSISLKKVRALGFNVGPNLWRTVLSFNPFLPSEISKRSSRCGRKRKAKVEEIQSTWNSITHHTSSDGKVFYGSRRAAAISVRSLVGGDISIRTILRYRPKKILFTAKPTDLCGVCIQIKRLRKALETISAQQSHMGGSEAIGSDHRVGVLQEKLDVLQHHKDYVGKMRSAYQIDSEDGEEGSLCVTIDWSSPIKFTSTEGSSTEFFNPLYAQCIGAYAVYFGAGGQKVATYIHAYGKIGVYNSKTASFTCGMCFFLLQKVVELLCPGSPVSINLWLDNARHFRNKTIFGELPKSIYSLYRGLCSLKISYHAPNHGKSPLDASFRWAQVWVRDGVDLRSVGDGGVDQATALESAYGNQSTVKDYKAVMCPETGPWACSIAHIPDISKISSVHYSGGSTATVNYEDGSILPSREVRTTTPSGKKRDTKKKVKKGAPEKCYVEYVRKKFLK